MTAPIRLFFFRSSNGRPNFGDELSPLVVSFVTGREAVHAGPWDCELTAIGSILDRFLKVGGRVRTGLRKRLLGQRIAVWGSGLIAEAEPGGHPLDILALRGGLTRSALRAGDGVPLGDPGLLVGRMIRLPAKTHAIGIVPHYVDKADPMVRALSGLKGVTVIDVETDAMTVTRQIAACGLVLSSSLHGLIVADAFGIPNQRLKFTGNLKGGDFKFSDYASALGRANRLAHALTTPEDIFLLAKQEFDLSYQGNVDSVCAALEKALKAVY